MRRNILKFITLSILAIFGFFVLIKDNNCIVVLICSLLKDILQPFEKGLVILFIIWGIIRALHNKNGKHVFLCCASLVVIMLSFASGNIAVETVKLAFSITITVFVSGTLSILITESGLVEFVAFFIERFMRILLKVPGYAAMDIITSFFTSSSVGVFITNQYFIQKKYTQKEASFIASNFSVVSFGIMFGIISIIQLNQISNIVIVTVAVLNLILGIILCRIYPISNIPDYYIDGTQSCITKDYKHRTFREGLKEGIEKAQEFSIRGIFSIAKRTLTFCQEILIQVVPLYYLSLIIMKHTTLFEWLGKPFGIILKCLNIPDAEVIAPGVFIGILEVSLPAVYITGKALSEAARFFYRCIVIGTNYLFY